MTYYKAFNPNLTCLGYQYEIGKTYHTEGKLVMCNNGFHCCSSPLECLLYYNMPLRLCEVSIGAEFLKDFNKTVTSEITIVREIIGDEFKSMMTGCLSWHGNKSCFVDGKLHSTGDNPAVIHASGDEFWYRHGKLHRDGDEPAIVYANGNREWYRDGEKHRDGDLPALLYKDPYGRDVYHQSWYKKGNLHRDGDKPAEIYLDGDQFWYTDGIWQKELRV